MPSATLDSGLHNLSDKLPVSGINGTHIGQELSRICVSDVP